MQNVMLLTTSLWTFLYLSSWYISQFLTPFKVRIIKSNEHSLLELILT